MHYNPNLGLRRRRGSLHYKRTGLLADVAELLGDSKRVAADHYVYALPDYHEGSQHRAGTRDASGLIDDAEAVAVRVDEDHKVVVRAGFSLVAGCAQSQQALDLACSVVGVEVEVHAADLAQRWRLLDAIERDVRAAPGRVGEYDPAVLRRRLRQIAERRLPEREHLVEPPTADDDGADPDLFPQAVG